MKLSRRGVDGQQFWQAFWACAINDKETQRGKLITYSLGDGKPVQWAKKKGNVAMLRRFEDNTCSVILNFSGVYLKGTLGFQRKESYSNRFLKEQKHKSGLWLRQQKDNGVWYWFCGAPGMLLCRCSRHAAWKTMFGRERHRGCERMEKNKYWLDWSA